MVFPVLITASTRITFFVLGLINLSYLGHIQLGQLLAQNMAFPPEDTTIVALMRGGLFFAAGMYSVYSKLKSLIVVSGPLVPLCTLMSEPTKEFAETRTAIIKTQPINCTVKGS